MSRLDYFREAPIAAISTATGGAIAVVRVSGKNLATHLSRLYPKGAEFKDRTASRIQLHDPRTGTPLDDAIVLPFFAPRSFTGEDVVEFHLHGGTYLNTRVMEVLLGMGVHQALPGEFSFRAVRNGKLTITQAQAISDLIAAQNDRAVALALDNLSGVQNAILTSIADQLRRTLTLAEAGIDFSDQNIDEVDLGRLQKSLVDPQTLLQKLADSFQRGVRIQDGIRLAVVGLPNAGKSSLFNALLGEERSIVSDIPGTTRDTIREMLTLRNQRSSLTFRIEDTAGLRHSHDPIEKLGIERSEKAVAQAEMVLLVVDPFESPEHVTDLWQRLRLDEKIVVGAFTKSDLRDPIAQKPFLSLMGPEHWAQTSATTREGLTALIDRVIERGEHLVGRSDQEVLITRMEHFHAAQDALENIERATHAPDHTTFSADLRQTLHALSPLIGETLTDTILEKIFSEFCIGK